MRPIALVKLLLVAPALAACGSSVAPMDAALATDAAFVADAAPDVAAPIDAAAMIPANGAVEISVFESTAGCARRRSGVVACWTAAEPAIDLPGITDAVSIAVGGGHRCVVHAGGTLSCWGNNERGQLGDGTLISRATPALVPGINDAIEVVAGAVHTCVRHRGGTASCWGSNFNGEIGDGTTAASAPHPSAVVGLADCVQLSAGWGFTCALRSGGAVACWGANGEDAVGDGTHLNRERPLDVVGVAGAVEISAGAEHACARRADGTVVCWGSSSGPQTLGGARGAATPVTVLALSDAVAVSAGYEFRRAAARIGGTVVCWNGGGLAPIGGVSGAVEVRAGSDVGGCARTASGAVSCWRGGTDPNVNVVAIPVAGFP